MLGLNPDGIIFSHPDSIHFPLGKPQLELVGMQPLDLLASAAYRFGLSWIMGLPDIHRNLQSGRSEQGNSPKRVPRIL